jgi:hypothetical protein
MFVKNNMYTTNYMVRTFATDQNKDKFNSEIPKHKDLGGRPPQEQQMFKGGVTETLGNIKDKVVDSMPSAGAVKDTLKNAKDYVADHMPSRGQLKDAKDYVADKMPSKEQLRDAKDYVAEKIPSKE